jgi:hypothetical protein
VNVDIINTENWNQISMLLTLKVKLQPTQEQRQKLLKEATQKRDYGISVDRSQFNATTVFP